MLVETGRNRSQPVFTAVTEISQNGWTGNRALLKYAKTETDSPVRTGYRSGPVPVFPGFKDQTFKH